MYRILIAYPVNPTELLLTLSDHFATNIRIKEITPIPSTTLLKTRFINPSSPLLIGLVRYNRFERI